MNIALLSILSLAASADTLVVEKADLVSSAPLIRPYQTDSVNLKEKTLDLKEALEKNKPFKPARVAQPAAAQVVKRGEALNCPENAAGVLRTLRFNVQTPRFVEATLSVEKLANHRVYVDGTQLSGDKLSLQPGRAEIVIQALTLAEAKDSFFVSLRGDNLKDVVVNASGKRPYTMKDMLLGESYSRCSMSPDGKFAVILTYLREENGNISYTTRLTELATGKDVFKLNGYTPYSWLEAEDHQLFFTRNNLQGRELVLFDAATRSETVLAEHIPDGNFEVSPKKDYLIYTLTEEGPTSSNSLKLLRDPDDRMPGWRNRSTLWKYDLASATMSRLTYGSAGVYLSDISQDAKKLLLCYTRFDPAKMPFERRTIVEMDAYTGKVDTLLADTAFISSAIYSPDATRLLISASPASFNRLGCEVGKDMNPNAFDYRLYLYDIASHRTKPLLPSFKPSVGNYQWSRGDGQIYFVADDASGRGIFSLNPESGAVKSYRIPIECVSGFSMAVGQRKNPDFMAFGQSGERARDMVIGKLDTTTPRVKPFGPLSFEKSVGDVAVGSCRDWKFLTSRGDSIDGFFFLPPNFDETKKYPMIVYYYGGCTPSTKCLEYQYPVQVLAGQGYVVYVVNPSGCIGYGQEFAARHVNAWGKRLCRCFQNRLHGCFLRRLHDAVSPDSHRPLRRSRFPRRHQQHRQLLGWGILGLHLRRVCAVWQLPLEQPLALCRAVSLVQRRQNQNPSAPAPRHRRYQRADQREPAALHRAEDSRQGGGICASRWREPCHCGLQKAHGLAASHLRLVRQAPEKRRCLVEESETLNRRSEKQVEQFFV